jgi:hypothetical protein
MALVKPSSASGTAIISVDSATQQFPSVRVGDTIQVNIDVSNVQNLWAWGIDNLKFNPSILNLTQVSEGPFLKQAGSTLFLWSSQSTIAFSKGDIPEISCVLLEQSSTSGSGVITTLTFQVISNGTSQITSNQTTLEDPNQIVLNSTTLNANITIGTSSIPEFPTLLTLAPLIMAATVSMLLFSKKVKRSKK